MKFVYLSFSYDLHQSRVVCVLVLFLHLLQCCKVTYLDVTVIIILVMQYF
jgi:hypothetical protein